MARLFLRVNPRPYADQWIGSAKHYLIKWIETNLIRGQILESALLFLKLLLTLLDERSLEGK